MEIKIKGIEFINFNDDKDEKNILEIKLIWMGKEHIIYLEDKDLDKENFELRCKEDIMKKFIDDNYEKIILIEDYKYLFENIKREKKNIKDIGQQINEYIKEYLPSRG